MPTNFDHLQGWHDDQKFVESTLQTLPIPVVSDVYHIIKDTGKGKQRFLYQYVQKCLGGKFPVQVQEIGDCVSFMYAHIVNTVKSVQALTNGLEEFTKEHLTSTEDAYAGSRVLIGRGQIGGDGSVGAWIAKYAMQYGTLCRRKYDNIDLSVYSGARARQWGQANAGPPKILLPYAREHIVQNTSQVSSYEEARDLIYNGYPVGVCSNQGFTDRRDKDGFASPSGNWAHAMAVLAVDDNSHRPGVLIQNSWPISWISGPTMYEQPEGSFWCDAQVFDRMAKQNDTFSYSNFVGFPVQDIDLRIV